MSDHQRLREIVARMRKYAGFWSWPDKRRRELGIVEDLLRAMNERGAPLYHNPRSAPEDPPDCVVRAADNSLVAVEVTEIVSEEAVRRNQQGDRVYRHWHPTEVIQEVASRLCEKDTKAFNGGPYSKVIALLHTDEPVLSYNSYHDHLSTASFGPFQQIHEAYVLFSYDPSHKYCPYVRLSVTGAPTRE